MKTILREAELLGSLSHPGIPFMKEIIQGKVGMERGSDAAETLIHNNGTRDGRRSLRPNHQAGAIQRGGGAVADAERAGSDPLSPPSEHRASRYQAREHSPHVRKQQHRHQSHRFRTRQVGRRRPSHLLRNAAVLRSGGFLALAAIDA